MRTFSLSFAVALVIPALACEVETLDVGNDAGGAAGNTSGTGGTSNLEPSAGTGGSTPLEPPPAPTTCETDDALAQFVGVWEGVEENFAFEPVQTVRLEIISASTSSLCGTLLRGELNPPPPPIDPDGDYPPEPWRTRSTSGAGLAGFQYDISGGARGTTLRVSIARAQLWSDWCAMQAPVYDAAGNVHPTCIEDGPGSVREDVCTVTSDTGTSTYTAAKCALCHGAGICVCTDAGCRANSAPTQNYEFTLTDEDGTLTLTAEAGQDTEFRLQRVD